MTTNPPTSHTEADMAHFYGTLQGSRGKASRLGTKRSDLSTVAASWEGAVSVCLYHNETTGQDCARVALMPWHGRGVDRVIYDGPVSGMTNGSTA